MLPAASGSLHQAEAMSDLPHNPLKSPILIVLLFAVAGAVLAAIGYLVTHWYGSTSQLAAQCAKSKEAAMSEELCVICSINGNGWHQGQRS